MFPFPAGICRGMFKTVHTFVFLRGRHLSLRMQILFVVVAFAVFPVTILGLVSYSKIMGLVDERLDAYTRETVEQAADSIGSSLSVVDSMMTQVLLKLGADGDRLKAAAQGAQNLASVQDEMMEFLQNMRLSFRSVSNIFVIDSTGPVYSSTIALDARALLADPWVRNSIDGLSPRDNYRFHSADYLSIGAPFPEVLSICRRVARAGEGSGSFLVIFDISIGSLNSASLTSELRLITLSREGEVFLVDHDGRIVIGRDSVRSTVSDIYGPGFFDPSNGPAPPTKRLNGFIYAQRAIGAFGWAVGIVPYSAFHSDFQVIRNGYLVLSLAFASLTILLSLALSMRIAKPLQSLSDAMTSMDPGCVTPAIRDGGSREVQALTDSFLSMNQKISELIATVALKERERTRAKLLALRLQINPHFLYNSLEAMRGSAMVKGADEAAEIARSLSSLLRYSLDSKGEEATIGEEIASLRNYFRIQKHRFGRRFTARISIDPAITGTAIPRFVLQPLAENAFVHSVELSRRKIRIEIAAHQEEDSVVVTVSDDGVGMERKTLETLQTSLESGAESTENGIGLHNVHNRIRLGYGKEYGLSIESVRGEGTTVFLRLPRSPWGTSDA